ncbi:MAG: TolC family protein [Verrucomicrobia bacterium]|nr:TolC family protein [Verrucomicrobiota bacterium]
MIESFLRNGLLLAVLAVLLTGCASFQDKPLSPQQTATEFDKRTLADAELKKFLETNLRREIVPWPPRSWDFQTLTMAAFYYHPDLDVARAQWATASAGRVTAGQRPNPTISVTPTYDTTTGPPWIPGVSFDVPIETAGKRQHRITQATQLAEAARLNIAVVAWQVRSRLRSRLLAWHAAQENLALLRQQESLQVETVRLLEGQFNAGAVAAFTVTQARVALNQSRLALSEAERQIAVTRAQTADALGVPLTALDGITPDWSEFRQLPPQLADATARRQALLHRADILSALADYAASEAALRLQIARQYPDVHLNPGYQLDQTDNKWTLGLSVELPMLSQNQGPIAEAEAKRAEIAAKFNALQARVLAEIEQALVGYRASLRKAAAAGAMSSDLDAQLRSARGMLAAGEIPRADLVQRQLEVSAAALAQLDARIKAQEAFGALLDALQSQLPEPAAIETNARSQTPSPKP